MTVIVPIFKLGRLNVYLLRKEEEFRVQEMTKLGGGGWEVEEKQALHPFYPLSLDKVDEMCYSESSFKSS